MIDWKEIRSMLKPIEKIIYDNIKNSFLRVWFVTDKSARDLADTVVIHGYNSDTYRDIAIYNAYISKKYGVDVFDCCPDIETIEAMYNMFAMVEDASDVVVDQEEPEIVDYKACWEALQDYIVHVIDRLGENKESSRNASVSLSAYLDISGQMIFIEELNLNSHWSKLSTADKIKALQNIDIQ